MYISLYIYIYIYIYIERERYTILARQENMPCPICRGKIEWAVHIFI